MRPVILGMNNPLSEDPRAALLPHPVNCAGWRLWRMVNEVSGISRSEWCRRTERVNLLNSRDWDRRAARERGLELWSTMQGRSVVVLGLAAREVLWLPSVVYGRWQERDGVRWANLPHPSGRNLWYNEEMHRIFVGLFLEELVYNVR